MLITGLIVFSSLIFLLFLRAIQGYVFGFNDILRCFQLKLISAGFMRGGNMAKVSIIIPVYNVEKYLERCLKSVASQTFKDIEIICVNDGSTDKSPSILEKFAQQDSRIQIISQENQGLSMARNNGLEKAKGEWTMFVDSDDALHPQAVEICLHFADQNLADLVCFQYEKSSGGPYQIKEFKRGIVQSKFSNNPLEFAFQKGDFRISLAAWNKFYKTSTIRNIPFIKGIYYEDGPHTYALLAKHVRTVVIDAKLYFYTQNMSSISNKKSSIKQLQDYKTLMFYINDVYLKSSYEKDIDLIRKNLFPKYLRNQYRCCQNAEYEIKDKMFRFFAEVLRDYKANKMISFLGCGPLYWLRYFCIMKKY